MTFVTLPLQTEVDKFTVRTTLLGAEYRLDFLWNTRDEHWYLSMFDATGTPIVQGVKVVIGNFILRTNRGQVRPRGWLVAIDKEGTDIDPGRNDLGTRVDIVFTDFQ